MVKTSNKYEKRGCNKRQVKCIYKQRNSKKIQQSLQRKFYKQVWFDRKPNKSFFKGEKNMSEELIKNKLLKKGIKFNRFEYYLYLGSTTINQLKKAKIISNKDYGEYCSLKPDSLLVDRDNRDNIKVIAVIEYKKPEEFNTNEKKLTAYKQCNTYCELLNADFGVITDGQEYIWINPKVDTLLAEVKYEDCDIFPTKSKVKRGFSYIKREDEYPLTSPFILDKELIEESKNTLILINKILTTITKENSQFEKLKFVNPSVLARSIYQDVWISKSAKPEEALSTFIEIFMFKFLSDLDVLTEDDKGNKISFDEVLAKGENKCLKYYFDNVRDYLKELFPENSGDGTTLINGIALSPSVKEDNQVFYGILNKFKDFGDLKNIDPEFKSRLFEDFLKKSISKKNWGQFFTPRNVVKAMIEMSGIEKLQDGANVCDPACGVGGFILEPIVTKRPNDYYIENGKLKSKLNYFGFERGFKQEDKLTIILAKSNFIIYLSDLIRDNPNKTKEFAKKYNQIFQIYTKTTLGSLSEVHKEKYDLIMSNPPYVTRGSSQYKKAIDKDTSLKNDFSINAMGVEGLFIEKICNEIKPEKNILLIIPEGILYRGGDKRLREHILKNFDFNALISLPKNTFYTTPIPTYIISLTKKNPSRMNTIQQEPIFTYFIKDTGEKLDKTRISISKNDLKDMVKQYKYFLTDKSDFTPMTNQCKVFDVNNFTDNPNWLIKRWLTEEEKKNMGIDEDKTIVKNWEDFENDFKSISNLIEEKKKVLKEIGKSFSKVRYEEKQFNDIFDIDDGFPFSSTIYTSTPEDIKLIRIQDVNNKSKIREVRIPKDFKFDENTEKNEEKINQVWVKKGDYLISLSGAGGFNISRYEGEEGYLNQRIVRIRLKEEFETDIIKEFIPVIFKEIKIGLNKEGFGTNNNLNKTTLQEIPIKIPINRGGDFDKKKQKELAERYKNIDTLKEEISTNILSISESEIEFE
jgi:type I restriction enzyme M protein